MIADQNKSKRELINTRGVSFVQLLKPSIFLSGFIYLKLKICIYTWIRIR